MAKFVHRVGRGRADGLEKSRDRLSVLGWDFFGGFFDYGVKGGESFGPLGKNGRRRLDDHCAAIARVRVARDPTGPLESVDEDSDTAGCEQEPITELALSERPVRLQVLERVELTFCDARCAADRGAEPVRLHSKAVELLLDRAGSCGIHHTDDTLVVSLLLSKLPSGLIMIDEHSGPLGTALTNTFGVPRGLLGRLGGRLMALEHRRIYPFVVDELAVQPADRILEIGCGSGAAAAIAVERATSGFVAAVDPSPVMVAQARRRLGAAIESGRARVVEAAAESLPFEDGSFGGVFTIFSLHHWPDRKQGLSEIRRVLRPGGRLVVCEGLGGHGHASTSPITGEELSVHYLIKMREFGFSDVECAEHEVGGRKLTIIKARRAS